jgi:hypothetical protein
LRSIATTITPNSVLAVNTVRCVFSARLADVDLQDIRIERLRLFARRHGVENSPGDLARLIGKRPNQVTNLLGKHSSFGEKVARSIEQAAGLPPGWLDLESEGNVSPGPMPAEVADLAMQVAALPPRQRDVMLALMRQNLELIREAVQATGESLGRNAELDVAQTEASPKQANGRGGL